MMRKIFFVAIIFLIAVSLSTTGYADAVSGTGSIYIGETVNLSKNVHASYRSADGSEYSASTYNDKGTQTYLTGSWTTYIYYADQTTFPGINGNSGDESIVSGTAWKAIGE